MVYSFRKSRIGDLIWSIILWIGAIFMVIPLLWMLSTSFKTNGQIFTYHVQWIPHPFIFGNYQQAWTEIPMIRFFLNSVIVACSTTVLQILVCALAAYGFARIRFVGREPIFMLFLGTMMIPKYILIIPLYLIMGQLNLINTYGGLILPGIVSAFSIFLLRQFFLNIPIDLDEAAIIDGCNKLQILFRIYFPLSVPALSALTILAFMGAWNDFFWPLIVTSTDSMRTLQLGLAYFQNSYTTQWGPLMAAATIATIPVLVVFFLAQKRFIQGITQTGIKG